MIQPSGWVNNIARTLVDRAQEHPDAPALIQLQLNSRQGKYEGIRFSFRDLNDETDRLARGLMAMGIRRGMRTVVMVPPRFEFYTLAFALFKIGAVVVLIDPGMGIWNLGKCLAEAEPEAFLGIPKSHLARIALRWGTKTIRYRATVGGRSLFRGWDMQKLRQEGGQGSPVLTDTGEDEMAAILFTSGSTGVAKGVVYSHGIFLSQVDLLRDLYKISPGEMDLPTFPLFGLFGPALGMTAILPVMDATRPGWVDPRAIIDPLKEYQITNLFGSPALLRRVSSSSLAQANSFRTLKRVISAGAPVSARVIRQVSSLLPKGVQVHTPYGATEALPVSSIGSDEILEETGRKTEQGEGICVGKPAPGIRVRIIRITDDPISTWSEGLEPPLGEIGEISVCGPVVTRSYYRRPESTSLHKIQDRTDGTLWHRMGDVGYLDEKGRIWFCGRKSQRVVTARRTYFTIPCEGVFNAHPLVFRTALVGVYRKGEMAPELCIEINPELRRDQRPDLTSSRKLNFIRDLFSLGQRFDHTRDICRFHIHPCFPVDIRHNAKIFREKLAKWASTRPGVSVS
ncbi:MAG: fatty acid CoA ligase family protein [Gemmataceae bacterium]